MEMCIATDNNRVRFYYYPNVRKLALVALNCLRVSLSAIINLKEDGRKRKTHLCVVGISNAGLFGPLTSS